MTRAPHITLLVVILLGVFLAPLASSLLSAQDAAAPPAEEIKILFLGDNAGHRPHDRFLDIQPVLAKRNIDVEYTDDLGRIELAELRKYDALLVYANIDNIALDRAQAILDYVDEGHAFIPIHCASFCFRNSPELVALTGAQFQRHGTGTFSVENVQPDHPIMQGYEGFESWDETYVHRLHNEENRTVLEVRAEGNGSEPWTWVRTQGKGRVFYTAWGHDQRTWSNPGFHSLLERGIRWAIAAQAEEPAAGPVASARDDRGEFPKPEMTQLPSDRPALEFDDVGAKIPNYQQGAGQQAPTSEMQRAFSPEESMKHIVTPVGFHVELFASEENFQGKPIAMNWDERGRLWICETTDYPNNIQPQGTGNDHVRICEDTDGDGKADKFTVFAENLSIPQALTFHDGGVIVQNARETLYLKDTDGDDVADERTILFTGWATGDTHGMVSNFHYGLDNWIWAMQGYNNSSPQNQFGQYGRFSQGFFRFKQDGSNLEFLRSTNNNTWGLGITEEGLAFGSTANQRPSVFMPIPNRYYERVTGMTPQVLQMISPNHLFAPITDRVRQVDWHGGYTAGAGKEIYTARAYPRDYWNRVAFVNGPTGHLTGAFVLIPDGAGFRSENLFNIFASEDEWTAPIAAAVGPDGAVWVLDWYNYIIQHNPTPNGFDNGRGNAYESDLRDKTHGRIYRVVYDAAPEYEPLNLADDSPQELVATLTNDNMLWRLHAQRLLVEKGDRDVVPDLLKLVADTSTDSIGLNPGAIHALWTLHGLGMLDGSHGEVTDAAVAALRHPSAGVRRNALMVLPPLPEAASMIVESGALSDENAQVQLAAILALADAPAGSEQAGQAAAGLLKNENVLADQWLSQALTSATAVHAPLSLEILAKSGTDVLSDEALGIVRTVAEHIARNRPDGQAVGGLLIAATSADDSLITALSDGLTAGWQNDHTVTIPMDLEQTLVSLMERSSPSTQSQLIILSRQIGSDVLEGYAEATAVTLSEIVANNDRDASDRIGAAGQLVVFKPNDVAAVETILDQINFQTPRELAQGLLGSLAETTAPGAGEAVIDHLTGMTPAIRVDALKALLVRPELTDALLAAAEEGTVQLAELPLDRRVALSGHPNEDLRRRAVRLLESGGGLPNADRVAVINELISETQQTGDVARGKEIFTKECAKCHRHSGEGENIGPDLTGMAVHPKEELIVHILDPSRSVESNYRNYTVITTDGVIHTGMLAGETQTTIELVDSEAKRHPIVRDDIEEFVASTKSVMPEGFEKQVEPGQLADLLEFLTFRGKYVPLDLRKVATVASDRGMFHSEDADQERLIFPDWTPKKVGDVTFQLIDPKGGQIPNVVLLNSPQGEIPPEMPKNVSLPVHQPAKAIHMLSGVGGWAAQGPLEEPTVSMEVWIVYEDNVFEKHQLLNGRHFADYISRFDVPGSQFAFDLRSQQVRYLAIQPQRTAPIDHIALVKGPDNTAPMVMAITVEGLD